METAENDVKEPMKFRFQESNESYSGSDEQFCKGQSLQVSRYLCCCLVQRRI